MQRKGKSFSPPDRIEKTILNSGRREKGGKRNKQALCSEIK